MARKVPLIGNARPIKEYNLDNDDDRKALGIINDDPSKPLTISDRYVVYSDNKRAVVEYKGTDISKAVVQLEKTAEYLINSNNKIGYFFTKTLK